jgi:hypothetical protein
VNLALIDQLGVPAYLESSNRANDHRYECLGFVQVGEFAAPGRRADRCLHVARSSLTRTFPQSCRGDRFSDLSSPEAVLESVALIEHHDLGYEQPPRQQRSLLDRGLSQRNLVPRHPTRVNEPDHASRTRQACRPPSAEHSTQNDEDPAASH